MHKYSITVESGSPESDPIIYEVNAEHFVSDGEFMDFEVGDFVVASFSAPRIISILLEPEKEQ